MNTKQSYLSANSAATPCDSTVLNPCQILVEVGLTIQRPENKPDQYGSSEVEVLFSALTHYREFLEGLSCTDPNAIEILQLRNLERNAFTAVRDRLSLTVDLLNIQRR